MFDWSRIQTGCFECNPVKKDISLLTEKIKKLLLLTAKKKDITLLNDIDKELILFIDKKLIDTTKGTISVQGTGLGLILCKELLERASGKIEVESELGVGSKFIITLPITI